MNQANEINLPTNDQEELNLKEIFEVIWKGKTSIFSICLLFCLGSVIHALTATHLWTSSSTLTVVADSNIGTSRSSAMSGLAGIAGISLTNANAGPDRAEVALATIKSRDFLKHILTFENILPNLMAAKGFNKETNETEYDSTKYSIEKGWLQDKPSYLQAMKQYENILTVSVNNKTQFLSISVEHVSPIFAYDLISLILQETNSLQRDRDLEEAEITLGYLFQELEKTQDVDLRLSINQLIESQMKKKMLARVKTNYLLEPLDLPYIPEERTSPRRTFIVLIGTMVGFFIGIMLNLASFYGLNRVNIFNLDD
jgi:LPS O-antigen subunit length determinant protein (WzzB/FepE family)